MKATLTGPGGLVVDVDAPAEDYEHAVGVTVRALQRLNPAPPPEVVDPLADGAFPPAPIDAG